jgi:hypothetical protein
MCRTSWSEKEEGKNYRLNFEINTEQIPRFSFDNLFQIIITISMLEGYKGENKITLFLICLS